MSKFITVLFQTVCFLFCTTNKICFKYRENLFRFYAKLIDHLPYLVLAVMSKYAVETSFLGHRVPKEVKLLLKNVKNVKKDVYSASIGKSKTKAFSINSTDSYYFKL